LDHGINQLTGIEGEEEEEEEIEIEEIVDQEK